MSFNPIFKVLFVLFLLSSCGESNPTIDIKGKWYMYSKDIGYTEFIIDTLQMKAFSHWMGNLHYFKYTISGDSIYIDNHPNAIFKINENITVLNSINKIDTLYRINDSIITYHDLHDMPDSIFSLFYEQFYKRAHKAYIKHGYYTQDEYDKSLLDTFEFEEEIIFTTNNREAIKAIINHK